MNLNKEKTVRGISENQIPSDEDYLLFLNELFLYKERHESRGY